ncbi:RNase H domain-containing protein [Trichonephila clavipes]|nr:RNase H domain-containing protein [Trichonephila clavipes]
MFRSGGQSDAKPPVLSYQENIVLIYRPTEGKKFSQHLIQDRYIKLKRLSISHQIHLQWIPSHIDLEGNEIADTFVKAGACEVPESSTSLTFLQIFSRTKRQNKTPHWYQCSCPEGSLAHCFTRQDQTLLDHFRSGHIKTLKFPEACKSFEMCTNCSSEPATPAHILECLGVTKQDLADDPSLVLDFLKVYDAMDLV